MSTILGAFNSHLIDFLEDVERIFPQDQDIKTAKTAIVLLKKANPRAIIVIWKQHITNIYKNEIFSGDLSYFVNKDYQRDITGNSDNKILEAIDRLRVPIQNMGTENKKKAMKYIQNLTKISELYT